MTTGGGFVREKNQLKPVQPWKLVVADGTARSVTTGPHIEVRSDVAASFVPLPFEYRRSAIMRFLVSLRDHDLKSLAKFRGARKKKVRLKPLHGAADMSECSLSCFPILIDKISLQFYY